MVVIKGFPEQEVGEETTRYILHIIMVNLTFLCSKDLAYLFIYF